MDLCVVLVELLKRDGLGSVWVKSGGVDRWKSLCTNRSTFTAVSEQGPVLKPAHHVQKNTSRIYVRCATPCHVKIAVRSVSALGGLLTD